MPDRSAARRRAEPSVVPLPADMRDCEAEEPISGVRCERPEGHDGAHVFVNAHTVIAWGWPT
jgi:hypothetical protein